ncbi:MULTISPECIES: FGGY-family carbohydrate kinase [Thalassospira]|uniref:FGGY family carbohydrate kinase n=1 Tax=Thalassospira aquimaris TaxID=3037796 RepID=A0ABT6GA09_9PROT|nr:MULTISPECIES: FGGY family carbohydrate kinase [Thalassospira]MDG4718830.1 FGGY family carbohydrate kinase [Thalassospira sp. FZY0004]
MTDQTNRFATAVIDIGKTNAKLVVWDHDGEHILFEVSQPNRSIDRSPYRHLDTEGLWQFYLGALTQAVSEIAPITIGKLIPTTHGATVVILNKDQLVLPVPDYENTYDASINEAYDAARDAFTDSQSPCLPAGLNFGRQIYALEQNFPAEMAQATDFLPYPQYWSWKFSGVKAAEVTSLGCHSDLWRPYEGDWSKLAKVRGWDRKCPPIRKAQDILGPISPELAKRTGLPADCQIYCGIHDSNASLVPLITQIDQPFSLVSSGTWTVCFSVGVHSKPVLDENRDSLCNVDFNGEAVPSARFMGGREYAFLAGDCTENPTMGDVERLIRADCLAIPSFAGAGGPFSRHSGRILNESVLKTDRDKAALATLYCALMGDYCLEMTGSGGSIIVEGPLAMNSAFCELLGAFRFGQQIFASTDSSGTSFGAAMLTSQAVKIGLRGMKRILPERSEALIAYRDFWRTKINQLDLYLAR